MSDDPFAEPGDAERTLIRPRPRGAPPPAAPARVSPAETIAIPQTGVNPLVAAAAPVLAAATRIADAQYRSLDPGALRKSMTEAIRGFETRALATGLDTKSLRAARYALCATVDDIVLSTPWGASSNWAAQTLTSVFHNEVSGGERFFDILEQMQKDMGHRAPVVELMYLCLAIGMEGRYRVLPRGAAELAELRDGVFRTLRARRGDIERDLSPRWRGVAAGFRPLSRRVPFWAIGLGTLAAACLMYLGFNFALAGSTGIAYASLTGLPPQEPPAIPRATAAPPPPVAAVASPVTAKLREFLAPEIAQGLVSVFDDAQSVTVRLANRNMFASGAAELSSPYTPLLGRIGEALQNEAGRVLVYGYTDNQPIHTVRFPSNVDLSQARADAVGAMLRAKLSDPKRVTPQGRGDADPIASNAAPDGRQQNRRTEIVLVRTDPGL